MLFKRIIHGEWCFNFFILLLRLLSYSGFKFVIFNYCCPTKTNLITGEYDILSVYNQDIKSTKWQITLIIAKRVEDY